MLCVFLVSTVSVSTVSVSTVRPVLCTVGERDGAGGVSGVSPRCLWSVSGGVSGGVSGAVLL